MAWLGGAAGFAALALGAGLYLSHAQSVHADALQQTPPPAATDTHQQQIAGQTADLLKMASDLKSAVDRSTKDTLSVTVVRKANEIEQLARKVRTEAGRR
jgi:hypothetical protein